MRAGRLLSILVLLQQGVRLTASDLARRFEVSVRTIHRDIDELAAGGVPVYAERGRDGGFRLPRGWRTPSPGMTAQEAAALPLAGVPAAAAAMGWRDPAARAQDKLLAAMPAEGQRSAQRVASRFHLDAVPWYHRAEHLPQLPALAAAVWDDRRIEARYAGWRGDAPAVLDPLGLVLKGGLWYLVALRHGKPRTFRIAGLSAVAVREARTRRPRGFDLAAWWARSSRAFEERLFRQRCSVRLSPVGLQALRDFEPAVAQGARLHGTDADGWTRADLPVEDTAFGVRQLLRYGAEIEVLAPASLRAALAAEARAVLARHRAAR
jgi:predicted DNA-binding transcriptional regulator YafY